MRFDGSKRRKGFRYLAPNFSFLKHILLFGAGKSATVLIDYLLLNAADHNWKLLVADSDKQLAEEKINDSDRAEAFGIDITDTAKRQSLISRADLVISMMPATLHILIARDCLDMKKHLLTASYADEKIKELDEEAKRSGVLFLCEMGLDPGIDHMSAMQIIDQLKEKGAEITSFKSHCGGLIAPESDTNPWRYKISWNPRNVVLAGKNGAIYREGGQTTEKKYEDLFSSPPEVQIDQQIFSYYPNRNSLTYIDLYGLSGVHTFIRTTLRYPDFMHGWKNIIELKLTDETPAYETNGKSLFSFFQEHFKKYGFSEWLQNKLAESFAETKKVLESLMKLMKEEEEAQQTGAGIKDEFMVVDEDGNLREIELDDVKTQAASTVANKMHEANLTMKQLMFLGVDDDKTIINKGLCSAADVLQFALEKKLALLPGDKDMIVMLHEIDYVFDNINQRITSSLVVTGDDNIRTAMAKTVGLPLGIAAKLVLEGKIKLAGVHVPTIKDIYEPVLAELNKNGIVFNETHHNSQ